MGEVSIRAASSASMRQDYQKNYYRRNKVKKLAGFKARRDRTNAFIRRRKEAPCMDCGLCFPPCCMDFDHKPEFEKVARLGSMSSWQIDKVMAELAKCDLVCANCHRIRTEVRAGRMTF